jgi:hypothetical protein
MLFLVAAVNLLLNTYADRKEADKVCAALIVLLPLVVASNDSIPQVTFFQVQNGKNNKRAILMLHFLVFWLSFAVNSFIKCCTSCGYFVFHFSIFLKTS